MTKKIPPEINNLKSEIGDPQTLRVLMVEDSENDALLLIRKLKKGGYNPVYERVDTAAAMEKAVKEKQWDIILCDYKMPAFSAPSAIAALKKINIDIPVIIVSGTIGEETAVECMLSGAHDYIMKSNLSRLCPAIARELKEAQARKVQKITAAKLHQEEQRFRALAEQSSDIIALVDPEGTVLYENPAVKKYLGFNPEERIGKKVFENVHPDELKIITDSFKALLKDKNVLLKETNEVHIRHRDGSWRTFEIAASSLVNNNVIEAVIVNLRDITQRKLAEERLQKSERKFKLLAEKINDIVWIADMNLRMLYITPSVSAVLGYRREELSRPVLEQMTPESSAIVMETMDRELAVERQGHADPNRTVNLVLEYYHKDGSIRWLETLISGLRDEQGVLTGIHGVSRDITERKKAEDALRQSEGKYRNIIESIEDGYAELDLKGNFLFVNNALCKINEYPKNELLKLNYRDIMNEENAQKIYAVYHKVFITGESEKNFEYEIITKNGIRKYLETSVQSIKDADNRVIAFRGIVRDRTERILAEEKFRKIFMTTPDCIFITRLNDGLINDVNKGFEEIVGWKREEAIGAKSTEPPLKFWVDISQRELMVTDLKAGRDILHREFEFRRRDGSVHTGIYSARPINISGEECIIFIMQDITGQRKMERELMESQKMKLMNQIASGVAHEVRNPLHAIQAISEAMAMDLDENSDYKEYLMHIKAQVERLSHLMNDLLDLGKPVQPSQFSLALLTEIASAALRNWLEAHPQLSQKVKVVDNLRPDDMVLVDTNKIQQVIINLMENAAQHSPQDEEILLTLGEASGNCLIVNIIDKGAGLKPQDQPKVFEPFYTTRKGGTGLGLSLCKHIIESHGGSIDLFNNINAPGCTARFILPACNSKEHK